MKIRIINAPSDLGVSVDGASLGPNVLKKHFLRNKNIDKIIDVYCDCSNKSYNTFDLEKNLDKTNEFSKRLYNTLLNSKDKDIITITVGGDHSIAIPSVLASIKKEKKLGILWIDTHPDFNTFETTTTGNIHGLPLATVTENNGYILTKFHDGSFVKNDNTIIIGARDIDKLEQINLNNAKIKVFSTNDIKEKNIKKIVDFSIKKALNNTNGIHVSIDIDVLDPIIAPGVSVSYKDGITKKQLFEIIDNVLLYKDKIKSFDVVEFNPLKDKNNKTEKIATQIINKIINCYKEK